MQCKLKGAIYARYSSDNQRDESIDAQVRAIEGYAERNNIQIVKVYADRAKSATSDKRPEFQQMIKDSALGIFDAVIVHKLDRFSRDKYDSSIYKRKLKKNGVRLISVTENLDGSPESVILESLLEGMAEYYSKNLAREVMKGMRETAYQCKHTGGSPPLGYDVGPDGKYQINEKEAEIVKVIFSMYIDGYSYEKIISSLNQKGYKTKRGNLFGKNSLHDIIINEKYCGVYVFNRAASKDAFGQRNNHLDKDESQVIRIEGGVPAIISKEDFAKAKQMMQLRKKAPGANKAKEVYLLSGLIFCGECGAAMQGNSRSAGRSKTKYRSYRCSCRTNKQACSNKEIRKEYLEMFVLSELERNILNDMAIPHLVKRINEHLEKQHQKKDQKAISLAHELKEVNKQIDNIIKAITDGFIQEALKDKLKELEEKKISLEANIQELEVKDSNTKLTEEQVKKLFGMFKDFVAKKNLPECKKFIHNYVRRVDVYKDHVEVIFNVVFNFVIDVQPLEIRATIRKLELLRKYRDIA